MPIPMVMSHTVMLMTSFRLQVPGGGRVHGAGFANCDVFLRSVDYAPLLLAVFGDLVGYEYFLEV